MRPRISVAASGDGFTLIEVLIALAILSVVAGAIIRVHLNTLRLAEFNRLRNAAVLESATVFSGVMGGRPAPELAEDLRGEGWAVSVQPVLPDEGRGLAEWRVAVSNPAAPVVSLILRQSGGAPQGDRPRSGAGHGQARPAAR